MYRSKQILVQRLQSGPYELYKEITNKPPQIETGWCMPNRLIDLSTLFAPLKSRGKKWSTGVETLNFEFPIVGL